MQVLDKGKVIRTATLVNGRAVVRLTGLTVGTHRFVVKYAGSPTSLASVSKPVVVKVLKPTKR